MLKIKAIPAFNDNYIWLLDDGSEAWIVDPGDAEPVLAQLRALSRPLSGILITHHHPDHVGGVERLVSAYDVPVVGPAQATPAITRAVCSGDRVVAAGLEFTVLEVPGHTLDHIAYWAPGAAATAGVLFCGDTLFAGGCGRVFEGTPAMLHESLQRLAALPPATAVYCAHEYTLSNLSFALAVDPDNTELRERLARDARRREQQLPTVPSTLAEELATNPFLRCTEPAVVAAAQRRHPAAGGGAPQQVFACLREWKNKF